MDVYLRTKFEVSSIILSSFRQGVILLPPPPPAPRNEPLKSPPRLGLTDSLINYHLKCLRTFQEIFLFVNPNGIKTLLTNLLSTFPIKGDLIFSNGPKRLPKNPPDCPILCN